MFAHGAKASQSVHGIFQVISLYTPAALARTDGSLICAASCIVQLNCTGEGVCGSPMLRLTARFEVQRRQPVAAARCTVCLMLLGMLKVTGTEH